MFNLTMKNNSKEIVMKDIVNNKNILDHAPEILLYFGKPVEGSGGLTTFFLFFNLLKKMNYRVKYCPLLKNISNLGFTTELNNKDINTITQNEIYKYFNNTIILKEDIVTIKSLKSKNNVVIYSEDIIGNPTQQKFVIRWLLFFPIPKSVKNYNFLEEEIWFYSNYIFNLYDNLCKNLNLPNYLNNHIQNPNILRVLNFNKYINYDKNNKNKFKRDGIAYVDRKFYPPYSFILNNDIKKIKIEKEINMRIEMKSNYLMKWGEECNKNFNLFFKKEKFISYDRFTFLNIIASLSGCLSIVKPIENLDAETWRNADPFYKYGVAYGDSEEEINYALSTQDKLYDHIYNLYLENENNIKIFMDRIESRFNINLHL